MILGVPGTAGIVQDAKFTDDLIVTRASGASAPCVVHSWSGIASTAN
jgi:hypothetical protein